MDQILREVPGLIESIGFLQTAILFLMCVFAFVIAKEKIKGGAEPKGSAPSITTSISCAWGEAEREALRKMERRSVASEERVREIQGDLDKMRERQIDMHIILSKIS